MYEDHFGFREPPFRITPDPRFLYRNPCVEEAAAALSYGIERRKGFLSLVGEAGTGKTTLLRHVLDTLSGNVRTVVLLHPTVEFDEILEYVMGELGVPTDGARKLVLLQRLHEFLVEHTRGGGNVALLIDEAQDLAPHVLEELRLLSNLETGTEKILQIVLAGQPELETKLADKSLRQLRQRIALHVRLRPLSPEEVAEYIRTRLELAGATRSDVFSDEATARIAAVTQGIPRIVNVLCDACLVTAYATNAPQVSSRIVDEAWTDYSRLVGDAHDLSPPAPALSVAPTPIVAAAAAAVASEKAAAVANERPADAPPPPPRPAPEAPPRPPASAAPEPAAPPPPIAAPPLPPSPPITLTPDLVDAAESADARLPRPDELRSPWWASPRRVSLATVATLVALTALNFTLRSSAPNRDALPTPETAIAQLPVVSDDVDPLVTAPSPAEARALVHEFMLAYEARDAERLAGLFAPDASDNEHEGVGAIRAAYAEAFSHLADVTVAIPQIAARLNGERLELTGPLRITYRDGVGTLGELRGSAEWEIARHAGRPRILRLRHDVIPRSS
jgi:general secretion pathway protein A